MTESATFGFQVEATIPGSAARAGRLATAHGPCLTPLFMPVGTQAAVKALGPDDLRTLGATCVLSNTYHLYLRPGAETIAALGGLHHFMRWDRPLLTDSGGFQVFSLSHNRKIDDDGVTFRSHIDGSRHYFTPERVMALQEQIGADIIMVLDECTPYPSDEAYNRQALRRTHAWAARCRQAHGATGQALFAIVQGGVFPGLRQESATYLADLDFPGYAVGGLSVGEPKALMHAMLEVTTPLLPATKPRYLMGVGSPEDLWEVVDRGIDMVDCVLPTRLARNGALLTRAGRLPVKSPRFARQDTPIEPGCDCWTCRNFSLAYIHHLFRTKELLAYRLNSIHNVRFLVRLADEIRQSILAGTFGAAKAAFLATYQPSDPAVAREQRARWLVAHGRGGLVL
ncbi:MAG TPA: tRNA guanosine(34) transglycosylase Tgt [Chloroflexia bacterium]|nr:tRNA guanosine(34) transglycosylase Tgt [Chloroflexia bacterium]